VFGEQKEQPMKKIHILGQELKLPETVEEFDAMSKSTEPLPSFGVYDAAIKSFQDSVIQHLIGLTNQEQGKLSNAEFVACLLVSGSITEAQLEEVCEDFAHKLEFNPGQPEVGEGLHQYLGDAVYAEVIRGGVNLRLNDHRSERLVFLEPEVLTALVHFALTHGAVRKEQIEWALKEATR
jgi:hypothetical protein